MRNLSLTIALFVSIIAASAPVDKKEAQQKAQNFIVAKTGKLQTLREVQSGLRRASGVQQEPLYVFNLEGGGYVIVSGDDRTEEILGYSPQGVFDVESNPENMKALLQEYADGIQYLNDHDIQITQYEGYEKRRALENPIEPLMKTFWSQGNPYNRQCPTVYGERTVTGCVATAMAQIMAYYRWPAATIAEIPAYRTATLGLNIDKVEKAAAINWEHIIDNYSSGYTSEEANAVAKLMMLCGRSVTMDYNLQKNGGSAANSLWAVNSLVKYFDYEEETCKYLYRTEYSYDQWRNIICEELSLNRPVIYSARTVESGHMFIIDGYQPDEFFHINWGWAGNSDGYYKLTLLKPTDVGVGGSASESGYVVGHGMGIGLQPNDGVVKDIPLQLTVNGFTSSRTTFTRTSAEKNFSFGYTMQYTIINETFETVQGDVGIRITDSDGKTVEELATAMTNRPFSPNSGYRAMSLVGFGANYADGDYQMVFVSRKSGAEEWTVCRNSDKYYMKFNITGNQMTVSFPVYSLSITNVDIVGSGVAQTEHTVKVTVKNIGEIYRSDVYAYINPYDENNITIDYEDMQAIGIVDLEKEEEMTFELSIVPTKNGLNKIYLVSDMGVFDRPIELQITGGHDIKCISSSSEDAILHHDSAKDIDYIYGSSNTFTMTMQNKGEGSFSGTMYVILFGLYGNTYYELDRTSRYCSNVGSGDVVSMSHHFDASNWAGISKFHYLLYYIEKDKSHAVKYAQLNDFELRDMPMQLTIKDPQVEHSSSTEASIEGDTFQFSSVLFNTGQEAFNDNVFVRIYEYLPSTAAWTYTEDAVALELGVGESTQLNYSFANPAKEEGAKYSLEFFYVYDQEILPLYKTMAYSFVEDSSGIYDVVIDTKGKSATMYDMHGRRVGKYSGMKLVKPGIYIIGGKKIIKK